MGRPPPPARHRFRAPNQTRVPPLGRLESSGRGLTGNSVLLGGYGLECASRPDFAGAVQPEGFAETEFVYYVVRARDKCGNVGP